MEEKRYKEEEIEGKRDFREREIERKDRIIDGYNVNKGRKEGRKEDNI